MATRIFSNGLITNSLSCVSASSFIVDLVPISPLSLKRANSVPKSRLGVLFRPPVVPSKRGASIVTASSDTPDGGDDSRSESDDGDDEDDDALTNDLALDAKLQNKLEKKMKMKVAKSVRLRRKKLIHKRRLRKKGRWPPSKTKKSTNV